MAVFIERTGGRAKCPICGNAIEPKQLRIVEEVFYMVQEDERTRRKYCHLDCAVELKRQYAHDALVSRDSTDVLVADALAHIERADEKLAADVRAFRDAQYRRVEKRAVALDDARTNELLAAIEATQDRALYAVLGDHLQQLGDERGELILLDLDPPMDAAAATRRRELAVALAPDVETHRRTWGFGFLRKLELRIFVTLAEHAAVLAHPSCRLLEALHLSGDDSLRPPIELPAALLPASLRTLNVIVKHTPTDLSRLAHLELLATKSPVTHATLRAVTLLGPSLEMLEACAATLPAVTKLGIHHGGPGTIALLADCGWLARVTELDLALTKLTAGDVKRLETALGTRKLARLAIKNCGLSESMRPRLQALCERLELEAPKVVARGPVTIEHANKPEWGSGTLVREYDGKVDVEFTNAGKKTFKADAPFLKRSR